jgi:hypothetical protein
MSWSQICQYVYGNFCPIDISAVQLTNAFLLANGIAPANGQTPPYYGLITENPDAPDSKPIRYC